MRKVVLFGVTLVGILILVWLRLPLAGASRFC